jgi:hypothetical protein
MEDALRTLFQDITAEIQSFMVSSFHSNDHAVLNEYESNLVDVARVMVDVVRLRQCVHCHWCVEIKFTPVSSERGLGR